MSQTYLEDISSIWEQVRDKFHEVMSSEAIELWFGDMHVIAFEDDTITLCNTTEFRCKIVRHRFQDMIRQYFCELLGFDVEIKITFRGESIYSKAVDLYLREEDKKQPPTPTFEDIIGADVSENEQPQQGNEAKSPAQNYRFEYTFDNFIIGESNKFAHAACVAVAKAPSTKYNPLFIYGQSGLGKTHLLYAIINELKLNNPSIRIAYVKGDDFTNQLIDSIRSNTPQQFRDKYRKCDVLLIDDIQFIAGKEATQDEFFHTFNSLFEDNKQIILASDRPARDINPLEDRLRSRFEWGLMADIQPPDLELRIAIIQKKAEQVNITLPDDVLMYLAENLRSNIRQIEGAIRKLGALTFLSGRKINMELAHSCISELLGVAEPTNVTVDKIFAAIFKKYNVHREDIVGSRRTKEVAWARHVSIYLIRSITEMSLPNIGKIFNRDHSTVMSSIDAVEKRLKTDAVFPLELAEMKKEITGR